MARLQAATELLSDVRGDLETRALQGEDDGDMAITLDGRELQLSVEYWRHCLVGPGWIEAEEKR